MAFKTYIGSPAPPHGPEAAVVLVNDGQRSRPLPLRVDLFNHSPSGFSWGDGGSGPAQLALALLADALADDHRAVRLHQLFKFRVVARWREAEPWSITAEQVVALANMIDPEWRAQEEASASLT